MATLIAGGLFATRVPSGSDGDVLGMSGAKFVKTKTSASKKNNRKGENTLIQKYV